MGIHERMFREVMDEHLMDRMYEVLSRYGVSLARAARALGLHYSTLQPLLAGKVTESRYVPALREYLDNLEASGAPC